MTISEFFAWEPGDGRRYELVGGLPVMKGGGRTRQGDIALSGRRAKILADRCRPIMAASAAVIPNGSARRPDAGMNFERPNDNAMRAGAPRLVIEVLSPSTRDFDMIGKLEEYKTIKSLNHIMLVDPDEPQAIHWWRAEDRTWRHQAHEGLQAVIEFPDLKMAISLSELYEGLEFTHQP